MTDPESAYEQFGHEQMLQAVLAHLLNEHAHELEDVCEQIGVPALADWHGQGGAPEFDQQLRGRRPAHQQPGRGRGPVRR